MSNTRMRVTIHDTIRGNHVGWGLSPTALIRDLIDVIVEMRGLPRFDIQSGPITYHLRRGSNDEALESHRRLADYSITEGEVLALESHTAEIAWELVQELLENLAEEIVQQDWNSVSEHWDQVLRTGIDGPPVQEIQTMLEQSGAPPDLIKRRKQPSPPSRQSSAQQRGRGVPGGFTVSRAGVILLVAALIAGLGYVAVRWIIQPPWAQPGSAPPIPTRAVSEADGITPDGSVPEGGVPEPENEPSEVAPSATIRILSPMGGQEYIAGVPVPFRAEISDVEPLHDIRWYLIAVGDPPYALGAEGTFLMPEGDYAVFALYGAARDRVQVHVGAPPQATPRPTSRPAPVVTAPPRATATIAPPTATTDPNSGITPTATVTQTVEVTDNTPSGPSEVYVDGASELGPVMAAVATEFQSANSEVTVAVGQTGANTGFQLLCNGQTDIISSMRPIQGSEIQNCDDHGIEWVEFEVGYQALAVVVPASNTFVTCLPADSVAGMVGQDGGGGTIIDTWFAVDNAWSDNPLQFFLPLKTLPSYDYLNVIIQQQTVMVGARDDATYVGDEFEILVSVGGTSDSLGVVNYPIFADEGGALSTRAIPISPAGTDNCTAPGNEAIQNGTYTLSRPVYVYADQSSFTDKPSVADFMRYLFGADGMPRFMEAFGYTLPTAGTYDAYLTLLGG